MSGVSSADTADEASVMAKDCEERETFPIYLLSFVYSLLGVSVIGSKYSYIIYTQLCFV